MKTQIVAYMNLQFGIFGIFEIRYLLQPLSNGWIDSGFRAFVFFILVCILDKWIEFTDTFNFLTFKKNVYLVFLILGSFEPQPCVRGGFHEI